MKIQKKFIKLLILMLILIIGFQTRVFANTLVLTVKADKDNYKVNETIDITVDWKEKMQAASFKIEYDSDKLEFSSANINENFYNSKNIGEITINWVSMDEKDLTQIEFQFKALKAGEAYVNIKEIPAFADGDLVSPTSYDISTSGKKTITIKAETEKVENKNDNNGKEDHSLAPNVLPKTGSKATILIIFTVVGILSVLFFYKNKKYSGITRRK